ncbi:hypothetical protein NOI20_01845 [Rhodobacteraceae bacterium 10Alg 79]|uniref:Glycosaminoglycan attachment site n=1 Tax=Rhodalgimonas zhirmunskyi TaxID=2964767 RepID=A0AAJ1UBH6_9RHOB|nr:hypothetical protein [Rhodoalgimonas zhirmunskyi]
MLHLFNDLVPRDSLHPNYMAFKAPDREEFQNVILDWAEGFIDRDGNDKFCREFQTTFNSSFWELYLFAVIKSLGWEVDFSKAAPDFRIPSKNLNIEAVVSNAAANDIQEWNKTFEGVTNADFLASQAATIERLSNSISSKLKKYNESYQNYKEVKDSAFIIAVGSYGTQDFFHLGDVAAQRLIYDDAREGKITKRNGSELTLGLFSMPEYTNVSAIIFSSTATFGKVRAISGSTKPAFFQATRIKNLIEPINASAPAGEYRESLSDGLRVFHNKNASRPIPPDLFGTDTDIMQFCFEGDDQYVLGSPNGDLANRQVIVLRT